MAKLPNCAAVNEDKAPLNEPIGVLLAFVITIFFIFKTCFN
jgi:hypothetical protein